MLKSIRTYRIIPALVAAALIFSVGLPLVQYACGMSGASVVMASTLSHPDCTNADPAATDAERPCHIDAASSALCPDADLCSSMAHCLGQDADADVPACCSQETLELEDVSTLDSRRAANHVVLPLSAVLTQVLVEAQHIPSLFPQPTSDRAPRTQVPLRVLFSSFGI